MNSKICFTSLFVFLLIFSACNSQELDKVEQESNQVEESPDSKRRAHHPYEGWYCPDNFGFAPIDIQKLDEVPAISNRLPTKEELDQHKSLISVDTSFYPTARALQMKLPRAATIYSKQKDMNELIVVIQAIVIDNDTIVGYRFANGGNGSALLSDIDFLSDNEVKGLGSQPFYYVKDTFNTTKEDIWKALCKTDYFQKLGSKFDKKEFFSSEWNGYAEAYLELDSEMEKARGYVGTVFGNAYLQIDYNLNGTQYSEKLLMLENKETNTTEVHFSSGPFPDNFEEQQSAWSNWFNTVKNYSKTY